MPAITSDLPALAQSIKDWGRELGFQQVGISGLDLAEHEQHLQRWLDAGYHGEMDYMGAHGSKRCHRHTCCPLLDRHDFTTHPKRNMGPVPHPTLCRSRLCAVPAVPATPWPDSNCA